MLYVFAEEGIVIHAGIMNYPFAQILMDSIVRIKRYKPWPEILLLLEHPPVITLGKTCNRRRHSIPRLYAKDQRD